MTTADSRRREKRRMNLVGASASELATRIVVDIFSGRHTGFHAAVNQPVSFRARPADQQVVVKVLNCDRIFYHSQKNFTGDDGKTPATPRDTVLPEPR